MDPDHAADRGFERSRPHGWFVACTLAGGLGLSIFWGSSVRAEGPGAEAQQADQESEAEQAYSRRAWELYYASDQELGSEAKIREALRIPSEGPEFVALELEYEFSARWWLLEFVRRRGDWKQALEEREALFFTLESFRQAVEPDDFGAQLLLMDVQARRSSAALEMDLGRLELASRELLHARRVVGSGKVPPELAITQNQLHLLTGRFDRVSTSVGESLTPDLQASLDRQALQVAIELDYRRLLGPLGDSQHAQELDARLASFAKAPGRNAVDRVRVLFRACRAALDAERPAVAKRWLEELRKAESELTAEDEVVTVLVRLAEAEYTLANGTEADVRAASQLFDDIWLPLARIGRESPLLPGGIGFFAGSTRRDLLLRNLDIVRRVRGDEAAFRRLGEARLLGSAARELDCSLVETARLVSWLDEHDAGALEWVAGTGETMVCAIDRRGPKWFELPALVSVSDDIEELNRRLAAESLSANSGDATQAVVGRLSPVLLPPELVAWIEPWTHVILGGQDWISSLELEALTIDTPSKDASDTPTREPLGLAKSVAYTSSVWLAHHLDTRASEDPSQEPARHLVLAATGLSGDGPNGSGLSPIPNPEGARLALSSLPEDRVDRRIGEAARFTELGSKRHELLSVLAHGVVDPSRLVPAGIALANPNASGLEFVWWEDLRAIQAPAVCALLTCGGSRGYERKGDGGYARLPSALLASGARSVLASARNLEARHALLLHQGWLDAYSQGYSCGEALRQAKRELAESEPQSDVYWATLLSVHGAPWTPLDLSGRATSTGSRR